MNAAAYRLVMPGKVYTEFVESSSVPIEEAWPTPTWTRCGRGYRYAYETTPAQALDILDHVGDVADGWMTGGIDDDARAAARVALRWCARERATLTSIDHKDA